mmetsp:Transcript_10088/g.21941  ORF Transcript_10088/g.21941 Transcript_10088/m.21941 type:complete len:577 (-) Transcript_10088:5-1735(-)
MVLGDMTLVGLKRLLAVLSRVDVKQLVRYYAVFALIHMAFKLCKSYSSLQRRWKSIKGLPGYENIEFSCKDLLQNITRLNEWRRDWLLKYPGAPFVRTSSPEVEVLCNTKESVKIILKNEFRKVTKPGPNEDYLAELGSQFIGSDGIFVVRHGNVLPIEHALWYNQRKTASKIFTKSNFMSFMYEAFSEKVDILNKHLEKIAVQNQGLETTKRSEGATAVDMQEKFFSFTFDSISKIFFGTSINSIEGEADSYANAFDNCHRAMMKHLFAAIQLDVITQLVLPFPFGSLCPGNRKWNPMFNMFRSFEPNYIEFRKQIDLLNSHTKELIRLARQDPNLPKRRDLLSNFLNSGLEYTDKQLRDVILNFILAGRDTTACALSWLFYELTQNPRVQDKLTEEIDRVLGSKRPTFEDLSAENMPYLNGVFMEALRLHPPVPEDKKIASEDIPLPDGTRIAAGVKLLFSPYAMGRDPTIYPDPLEFKPERWIPFKQPSLFEFPVFQAGNRFCLGKDMATFEAKLVTSSILQKFTFELEGDENPGNITYSLMLTMSVCNKPDQTSHNLWVVPKLRHTSCPKTS